MEDFIREILKMKVVGWSGKMLKRAILTTIAQSRV